MAPRPPAPTVNAVAGPGALSKRAATARHETMSERVATCRCGQYRAVCTGEPVRVSVCHCLNCQKRSGSAFAVQARYPEDRVRSTGEVSHWSVIGENGANATFRFCPRCGATVTYVSEAMAGFVAVAVGAFADPGFVRPSISGYEERRHGWAVIAGDDIAHFD